MFSRARKRDVLLSSEIANTDYPEEPNDEDVLRVRQEQQQMNDAGADSDTSSLGDDEDSFRMLYNAVKTYKLGTQTLIDPFMKLPNRRAHQDYYEEIQRPIAMSIIKNHIKVRETREALVTLERLVCSSLFRKGSTPVWRT